MFFANIAINKYTFLQEFGIQELFLTFGKECLMQWIFLFSPVFSVPGTPHSWATIGSVD